jgi:hypothetical protein
MPFLNLLRIVVILLVQGSIDALAEEPSSGQAMQPAPGAAQEMLQKWIAQQMYFLADSRGVPRLFLRREAVKAGIISGSLPIKNEVVTLIASLSRAAGVPYELTLHNVNFAIVVDSPINDGDKPNPRLWKRVGLSEDMYNIVSEEGSWASGCGIYSFTNTTNGEVSLSITFADSKLEPAQIKDCVIEGTIRAFGLRLGRKVIMRSDDGYFQFVTLAKALGACERTIGIERLAAMNENEQKSKYVACAADLLKKSP